MRAVMMIIIMMMIVIICPGLRTSIVAGTG